MRAGRVLVGGLVLALCAVLVTPVTAIAQTGPPPPTTAVLEATRLLWQLVPPSPDSAGVTYLSHNGRLLMSDSEVNEEDLYVGANLWELSLTGAVAATGTTLPWSDEPTGVSYNPTNRHLYVSTDGSGGIIYDVDPGVDGIYGTGDDTVLDIEDADLDIGDAEGLAFDRFTGHMFVSDGVGDDVVEVDPGPDGLFNGVGDTIVNRFDVGVFGAGDPEGIVHNHLDDTLLIVDHPSLTVYEVTKGGLLVRSIDISAAPFVSAAGIALAPASNGSGGWNMYIVDRGIDNGADSDENDGVMYEMSLDFTGVGGRPTPGADFAVTAEDSAVTINVAGNDSDPDGNLNPSSASASTTPSSGTTTDNGNGTITYTPTANFFGADSFDYRICDTTGNCATATVNVTVNGVPDPPIALNDSGATTEDDSVTINVALNDSDIDGDLNPSSASTWTSPASGETSDNGNGTITYTPDPDFFGVDGFDYRICDFTGTCSVATVTVTVSSVPDTPTARDDDRSIGEDQAVTIDVAANDSDPDGYMNPASASPTTTPASGNTTTNADGTITYTPSANFFGADSFDYRICDTTNRCATATVDITVNPIPDPPTARDDGAATDEDQPVTISVAANDSDPDGDMNQSSAAASTTPGFGTTQTNFDGTITYTPNAGFFGVDSFDYRICDDSGRCAVATVTVSVGAVGPPPDCFGLTPTIVAVPGVVTYGTDGADVIVGTAGPDEIHGLGGDDVICGLAGADIIRGNGGRDMINAGGGADMVWGGKSGDLIKGSTGPDLIWGNSGHDTIFGNKGHDTILGGKGRDILRGNTGADILRGNTGFDECKGGFGPDTYISCNRII
ncbi:MAG: tandem-95 repeat protein [Actinomycetota bacterium]